MPRNTTTTKPDQIDQPIPAPWYTVNVIATYSEVAAAYAHTMKSGAVFYRNCWLMPGSEALRLYEERHKPGGQAKLDEHMRNVEEKARRLGDVVAPAPSSAQGAVPTD